MRARLITRVAERLDRQAEAADREAAEHGLIADRTGRWSRTYRDPRVMLLWAVRDAGCFHAPACRIVDNQPECLSFAAWLRGAA